VVDNGSKDNSVEMLKDKFRLVKIIQNERNLGFSKAVNRGLSIAEGDNVLLLNSDVFITNNSFFKMISFLEKRPDIVAISCKVFYPDGKIQPALSKYPSLSGTLYNFIQIINFFPNHRFFNKWNATKWDYNKSRELTPDLMIGGGCFMIRKKCIDEIGFMDENFSPAYCEDADWCYRINEKGLKMYYLAEAEIYHHHGYTFKNTNEKFKEYITLTTQKNRQYFFKKHYGFSSLLLLKIIDFLQNMLFVFYIVFMICLRFRVNDRELYRKLKLHAKLMVNSFLPV
jgi:hypothetical protein|tara:strand:+ start:4299 stop:5150 length:852 start_codon:yes stop_codon:yes gene_type:complete